MLKLDDSNLPMKMKPANSTDFVPVCMPVRLVCSISAITAVPPVVVATSLSDMECCISLSLQAQGKPLSTTYVAQLSSHLSWYVFAKFHFHR